MARAGRVLIIVENLSAPFDRRVWREATALKEAGYDVSVISPRGTDRDTERHAVVDGIPVYRFTLYEAGAGVLAYFLEYGLALFSIFWLILKVWQRHGLDVIQICNPPDLLFFVARPFQFFGKRVIFDHHDLWPELWVAKREGRPPGPVYPVLLWCERQTFRIADLVISTNESYKRIAMERGGVAEDNIFIVRNGPALHQIREAEPNPALRKGKEYLLVYIGMMGNQDGLDYLLRSVQKLKTTHGRDDFHVLLMGDGPERPQLERMVEELGIKDEVTFTGLVEHDMVFEGIASADVCLCPDPNIGLNDKSTLVKVMEYMGLGKPVVAFDLTETRASAAEAALYATPNDEDEFAAHIDALLSDPEERERRGAIGRERIHTALAWDHVKENLLAAYDRAFDTIGHGERHE